MLPRPRSPTSFGRDHTVESRPSRTVSTWLVAQRSYANRKRMSAACTCEPYGPWVLGACDEHRPDRPIPLESIRSRDAGDLDSPTELNTMRTSAGRQKPNLVFDAPCSTRQPVGPSGRRIRIIPPAGGAE
jgi:hypothetical protein